MYTGFPKFGVCCQTHDDRLGLFISKGCKKAIGFGSMVTVLCCTFGDDVICVFVFLVVYTILQSDD